jgi:hypothetical protein
LAPEGPENIGALLVQFIGKSVIEDDLFGICSLTIKGREEVNQGNLILLRFQTLA